MFKDVNRYHSGFKINIGVGINVTVYHFPGKKRNQNKKKKTIVLTLQVNVTSLSTSEGGSITEHLASGIDIVGPSLMFCLLNVF